MLKAKSGDIIVFDRPVEFLDGNVLKELRLIERSNSTTLLPVRDTT